MSLSYKKKSCNQNKNWIKVLAKELVLLIVPKYLDCVARFKARATAGEYQTHLPLVFSEAIPSRHLPKRMEGTRYNASKEKNSIIQLDNRLDETDVADGPSSSDQKLQECLDDVMWQIISTIRIYWSDGHTVCGFVTKMQTEINLMWDKRQEIL